jgi:hypothetical protein
VGGGGRGLVPTWVFVCQWVCNVLSYLYSASDLGTDYPSLFAIVRDSSALSHITTSWYMHVLTTYVLHTYNTDFNATWNSLIFILAHVSAALYHHQVFYVWSVYKCNRMLKYNNHTSCLQTTGVLFISDLTRIYELLNRNRNTVLYNIIFQHPVPLIYFLSTCFLL